MGVIDRRAILGASVAISLVAHALILAVSPNVTLVGKALPAALQRDTFRVRMLDDADLRRFEAAPGPPGSGGLATRPGSITDLLQENRAPIEPLDNALAQTVDVPDLENRVADDAPPVMDTTPPNPDIASHVDAQILEIAQAVARPDVQIERRLVAPSSTRILPEGETPVLRGVSGAASDELLMIDPLSFGGAGGQTEPAEGAPTETIKQPDPLKPERESSLVEQPEDILRGLPDLPVEKVVARSPVVKAIEQNARADYIDDLVVMQLSTFVPEGEREGYFRLQIVPKEGESLTPLQKDVTFVIDASSSILQRKLDETVRGVQNTIGELRADDQFNIVIFRDTPTMFQPALVPASKANKSAAAQFLTGLQARGETDVYQGIRPVISQPSREGVPGIVFIVSDGKPTTGIRDGRTLINALTDENASRYSIYAFSGGRTVNQHLLDLLAYRNKGESTVTPQIENMDRDLPGFFSRLNDPILVDCNADFGRINESNVFPKQIPDFFRGQVVTVYGRFDPKREREFAMRLTGAAGDRKKEVVFRADLTKASTGDDSIARNWAFRKIYFLIGEITKSGETPELLAQIRALAEQYKIRTSYDQ